MAKFIIHFDFYGEKLRLSSDSEELISRLSKDFSYFKRDEFQSSKYSFEAWLQEAPKSERPSGVASKQSLQSLSFDYGHIRYNDYHGKLLSRFDYSSETAKLWSTDIEKLHEVSYLLILSRVGKALDLRGLNKVHAMSFTKGETSLIGMMPMKGGKSTLLANLLNDQSISIISDDCPIINLKGDIIPFPLRLGVDELSAEAGLKDPEKNCYVLERDFYGTKKLISLEGLPHSVGLVKPRQILFVGKRAPGQESKWTKVSKFSMIWPLFINKVVGLGLPMVMEYFWENGFIDFFRKARIAILRVISAMALLIKSECYEFQMSDKPQENAKFLLSKIN